MTSIAQAKTLGGIGSIFVLLSIVPRAGVIFGIIGFVLMLVAVKYISDELKDKSIFNNMLISVILAVVGIVTASVFAFARLFRELATFGPSRLMGPRIFDLITTIIIALFIIWIFYIVSAVYLRKSYSTIASKLNVGMFGTTALLYLIGAVLTIVLVGFFIIFVAEILQVVAFFSLPEQVPQQTAQAVPKTGETPS